MFQVRDDVLDINSTCNCSLSSFLDLCPPKEPVESQIYQILSFKSKFKNYSGPPNLLKYSAICANLYNGLCKVLQVPQRRLQKQILLQTCFVNLSPFYKNYDLTTPSSYFIIGLPPPAALECLEDIHDVHVLNMVDQGGHHN